MSSPLQEIKARFGSVHYVGFGLVEADAQSFQHMAHHFQRFLYIFLAQIHKVICVAHETMVHHYARIVFASTVQDYEGSGRGFTLRFSRRLDRSCPRLAVAKD